MHKNLRNTVVRICTYLYMHTLTEIENQISLGCVCVCVTERVREKSVPSYFKADH